MFFVDVHWLLQEQDEQNAAEQQAAAQAQVDTRQHSKHGLTCF